MLKPAASIFQAQIPEVGRSGVLGGPHPNYHLRARPQVQLIDPHIEVVSPLIEGNHQAPGLLLELAHIIVEVVPCIQPECPLGQHSCAIDELRFEV